MLSEKSSFTGMRFMPKEFFDVFPTLKVNDNLRGLLSQATVTRVTVTSARDRMRVYLESPRLLYWQSVQDTKTDFWQCIDGRKDHCQISVIQTIYAKNADAGV